MIVEIFVPTYDKKSFSFVWEEGFAIKCEIANNTVMIKANKSGLISLARHLLELSQDNVPKFTHVHLDEYNSLEDNSAELIITKL